MSRHALTDEDMVDFAENNPWAFTARQGSYERVYGWAIVSLMITPIFLVLALLNITNGAWAVISSIVFGVLVALSTAVLVLSAKKLSYYDDVDSRRIKRISKQMKEQMKEKYDSADFRELAKARNPKKKAASPK